MVDDSPRQVRTSQQRRQPVRRLPERSQEGAPDVDPRENDPDPRAASTDAEIENAYLRAALMEMMRGKMSSHLYGEGHPSGPGNAMQPGNPYWEEGGEADLGTLLNPKPLAKQKNLLKRDIYE